MAGTPLPDLTSSTEFSLAGEDAITAYHHCRALESWSATQPEAQTSASRAPPLVAARVLGYLLLVLSDDVRPVLGSFILAFRRPQTTPAPSEHPSRPSFDDTVELYKESLEATPRGYKAGRELVNPTMDFLSQRISLVRVQTRKRDNYRCSLTGAVDFRAKVKGLAVPRPGERQFPTEVAHIIPKGLFTEMPDYPKESDKREAVASVVAVLSHFSNPMLPDLGGEQMNQPSNLLLMEANFHQLWDDLAIYLEPTGIANQYRLCKCDDSLVLGTIRTPVTFTTTDPATQPVLNPEFLRLHATCARVAHLSGAGEYIDHILRWAESVEDVRALDEPHALQYLALRLEMLQVIPPVHIQ
ncbi:hypothetical protein DACRYDRAFT_106847 [Dacryopinax primogenitus]|uniref:HNH nuclease domain-containing protein n=1 Tax=Dacryopinax primogenitus (strain DJM 731) TaxID=1858805 RepID=M5FXN7_DACPD|nr:uncharacterized protein DACRYDRAFT_106847 [Dacryopinax primogenitus]EJU02791.1 hypothetical protein DACRYDRAFT_106847 [Dacryopinax primogenitus]